MTLPALIHKNQNKALEASLKKNYSAISQALEMYQAQTGERIKAGEINSHELKPALMKYLKSVKDCGSVFSQGYCIKNYASSNKRYKTFNSKNFFNNGLIDDGIFVLLDGSTIMIENAAAGNNNSSLYISVDVNGFNKSPNTFGKDTFMFQIDPKGNLLPMGAPGTTYYSKTDELCSLQSTSLTNGAGCTYKALTAKDYWNSF